MALFNIFYIAFDQPSQYASTKSINYKQLYYRLIYQLEAVAGIGCFVLSHASHAIKVNIYTNHPREWNDQFAPLLSNSFKNIREVRVVNSKRECGEGNEEHPLLTKVRILNQIAQDSAEEALCNVIYLDGDHISLRPWAESALDVIEDQDYEIAMAHECGLTDIKPIPNYNSGLIFFKPSNKIKEMMCIWLNYSTKYCCGMADVFNDQHTLVYALAEGKVKVLTLPEVVNLRCHPAYGSAAHVWSDVYAVHNHDAASIFVAATKMAIHSNKSLANYFNAAFSILDEWFNPTGGSHLPRCVSLTSKQTKALIGQLFSEFW